VFSEGTIIYFTPFYFKNGNTSKNKYFIVLKLVDDKIVLGSLPTRSNKIPSFINVSHGCVNDDASSVNCYVFGSEIKICDNGFSFGLSTFCYGNEVEDYEMSILEEVYCVEGVDYEVVGVLLKNEFDGLIQCIKQSKSVKRRIQRLL